MRDKKIKILIVCQWPLGGIRTYLKYNYELFPNDEFESTLLANSTIESDVVKEDMSKIGIKTIWANRVFGKQALIFSLYGLLKNGSYDIIHSQGFISSVHIALINWIFRRTHVLTIHGILEDRYFEGKLGWIKKIFLRNMLKNVDVFHGVGNDILEHLKKVFPQLLKNKSKWIVITNGIKCGRFLEDKPDIREVTRQKYSIDNGLFIFGFFGRFMPQKGFDYIIEAVEILKNSGKTPDAFRILSVGSGDYIREYKSDIDSKKLNDFFIFLPFTPDISDLMKSSDVVLMPSLWEAWSILANEVFVSGIPLIASTCIGLRESIKGTPAITIPPRDSRKLAEAMELLMADCVSIRQEFLDFRSKAAEMFDVKRSASKLQSLFKEISKTN